MQRSRKESGELFVLEYRTNLSAVMCIRSLVWSRAAKKRRIHALAAAFRTLLGNVAASVAALFDRCNASLQFKELNVATIPTDWNPDTAKIPNKPLTL